MRVTLLSIPLLLAVSTSAFADPPDRDPVKCVLVKVRERDLGEKSVSPGVEIDWLKDMKYSDKIPASSQELLCKTRAMYPAIEWAKTNDLCGPNIKYVVEFGRQSSPKSIEGGAICNRHKPLGH